LDGHWTADVERAQDSGRRTQDCGIGRGRADRADPSAPVPQWAGLQSTHGERRLAREDNDKYVTDTVRGN